MKIRTGFVSNSSSSSFLIATKNSSSLADFLDSNFDEFFGDIPPDASDYDDIKKWSDHTKNRKKAIKQLIEDKEFDYNGFTFDEFDPHYNGPELWLPYLQSEKELRLYMCYEDTDVFPDGFRPLDCIKMGWKLFHWNVPDYGDGGNFLQYIVRNNLSVPRAGKGWELMYLDHIWDKAKYK